MFDYSKLLGKIKEHGLTNAMLAKKIGTTPTTLSLKLSNKASFKQKEIAKCCELLHINTKDVGAYFFTKKV